MYSRDHQQKEQLKREQERREKEKEAELTALQKNVKGGTPPKKNINVPAAKPVETPAKSPRKPELPITASLKPLVGGIQQPQRSKRNPSNERAGLTASASNITPVTQNDQAQVKQRRAKSQPQMYARQVVSKPAQGPETQPATPRRRKSDKMTPPSSPPPNNPKSNKPSTPTSPQQTPLPIIAVPVGAVVKTSSEEINVSVVKAPTVNPWNKNRSAPSSTTSSGMHSRSSRLNPENSRSESATPKNIDTSSDTDSDIGEDIVKRSQSAPRSATRILDDAPARQTRSTSVERTLERTQIPGMIAADNKHNNRNRVASNTVSWSSQSPELSPPESPDPSRGRRSNSCGVQSIGTAPQTMGRGKEIPVHHHTTNANTNTNSNK